MTRLLLLAALAMGGCGETPPNNTTEPTAFESLTLYNVHGMPCVGHYGYGLTCDWSKYQPQGEGDE